MDMNTNIIPATWSETGDFIVAINTTSNKFKYLEVMKKHLDENVITWFLQRNEYTPQELINGIKRELKFINSVDGISYRYNNNLYPKALELTLDLMVERYSLVDFPEFYI
jgi:hypothetical protein